MTAIAHGSWTHKVGFLADGRLVSSGADGVVRCWSSELTPLWANEANLTACCAGGALVAGFNGRCGTVVLWDTDGHELHVLPGHPTATPCHGAGGNTGCACFTGDGARLATGGFDDVVRLWDTATGREVGVFPVGDMVWSVALSRDGALLAAGTHARLVHLFDVTSGKKLATVEASRGAVTAATFTPDGGHLITGGGRGEVRLWRVDGGELRGRGDYGLHQGGVEGLAVSPCGTTGASVSRDGRAQLFDVESGQSSRTLMVGLGLGVALSPDGARLAIGGPPIAQVVLLRPKAPVAAADAIGRSASERVGRSASERVGQGASERVPRSPTDKRRETASDRIRRAASDRIGKAVSDRIAKAASQREAKAPDDPAKASKRARTAKDDERPGDSSDSGRSSKRSRTRPDD